MPGRPRRKYYRRRRFKKRGAMSVAKKALRLANAHKPELKEKTTTVGEYINYNGVTGGAVIDVTYPEQGVDVDDRVGNVFRPKWADLRLNFEPSPTTGGTNITRFMLVVDKRNALSTASSYITNTGQNIAPLSPPLLAYRSNYMILYDSGPFDVHFVANSSFRNHIINKRIPLKFLVRQATGAATAYTNKLKLVIVNDDSNAISANSAVVAGTVNLRYTDA